MHEGTLHRTNLFKQSLDRCFCHPSPGAPSFAPFAKGGLFDQSIAIQQVLSAGPIENLLSKFGEQYIERVEHKARKDPAFAKVLGGVWQSDMPDEIWTRLQAVWDRRGWDGIPE